MTSVWATRPTLNPGAYVFGEELERLVDQVTFLTSRPRYQGRQTTLQAIPNGTFTALVTHVEDIDNYSGHATNGDRYTSQVAGLYTCSGSIGVAASASVTTQRGSSWYRNGLQVDSSQLLFGVNANTTFQVPAKTMDIYLGVGDYVELRAYQNTGGALNTDVSFPGVQSMMRVEWAAEA